ncbi:MAG: reverse transcriptase domain-containing protein [Terriglobia bacterium]|nr:reverse transcriptase domain-containing protein [Terriglobia bacterium]
MLAQYATKEHLALALGVSFQKHLVYYLHRLSVADKYRQFEISKRSGGRRLISAPHHGLKHVQKRLAAILAESYGKRTGVHGYLKGRGIQTNAENHVRQPFVLNIDLADFFGSINFGRVRGILMSPMYGANDEVATVIAQLCCFENSLPQGAPTSPILSNIICGAMDADFKRFAYAHRCKYSRYSDDITFSCGQKSFPAAIAAVSGAGKEREIALGTELLSIVNRHGFVINEKKTRLLTKSDRQEVTGLVVNRFVNVPRKYVRNLWSVLHAWRKYGTEATAARYKEKFEHRTRDEADFESVMLGRIQYVGSVRGFEDEIYVKLRRSFNQLSSKPIPTHESTWQHKLENGIWVVEHLYDEPGKKIPTGAQGTAFFLKDVGLVTCAHCLGPQGNYAFHPSKPAIQYEVEIVSKDDTIDLAILKLKDFDQAGVPSFAASADSLYVDRGDRMTLAGWPKYGAGSTLSLKEGMVQSIKNVSGVRRFNVSTPIIQGNSGGPIFNIRRQVIGVAVTGAHDIIEEEKVEAHGAIPIAALSEI